MTIWQKMFVNSFIFALGVLWIAYREIYVFHPDLFTIFDLKM